ncbi:hypothetical protein [Corynebacterium alimapuense]|uniref:Uncharacterized protein n=1 Tax=Corynebacterium alimapuense TaxID=1576874 RepID=A0A3M8K6R7_9CORY|nr:hypothetical protein [Corynebacterium alimapuense]RNE48907.1 hypothetical protein C5L39_06325 [Corynebacterium alimapuense]
MSFEEDPTRIPAVLEALGRAWEGQSDLSLATFFGILANRGVGWGSTDRELLSALAMIEHTHPGVLPRIDGRVTSRFLVNTENPAHRVTLDPSRVIVRRPSVTAQPGVWAYIGIRPAFVGGPLVVSDQEGIDHRLGVISRITLLDDAPLPSISDLSGVQRRDLGDAVFLVALAEGQTVLVDHGLHHFNPRRRQLEHHSHSWESLQTCRPGEPLRAKLGAGASELELGEVLEILVLEDQPFES